MRGLIQLLVSVAFLVYPLHARADDDGRSIETTIEAAFRDYVQEFVEGDFEGIADQFRLPATFEAESVTIFHTRDDVIHFFKEARANIQEGYSYSTLDSIEIRPITEQIYSLDVVYRRFDANAEQIYRGRTVYLYKQVGKVWKMILLSPHSNP